MGATRQLMPWEPEIGMASLLKSTSLLDGTILSASWWTWRS